MLQWINHQRDKIRKTIAILGMAMVFFIALFPTMPAQAQSVADQDSELRQGVDIIQQPLGLPATDIREIIANIIRAALGLLGLVTVILMMYAGYLWMTAGGNDEQIIKAKSILKNAVIGLAIILSAYSIVLFVMKMLGIGEGGGGVAVEVTGPNTQNFQGSGALGTVIKDHYPLRNQEDVARNTKIVVTFRRPVLLSSFVRDTNGNGVFGDCRDTGVQTVDWKNDCDQLIMDNEHINVSRVAQEGDQVSLEPFAPGAVVLATSTMVSGLNGVYTIVIRPNEYLGSTSEKFTYMVRLGRSILLDDSANDNPSVFSVKMMGNDYYEWQFSCSTLLDYDPPRVISVYPRPDSRDFMNTAIQINFSEPMDPTGLQGQFAEVAGGGYYALQGNNIFLKSDNSSVPLGSFNIVNNYQTLEFVPSKQCGVNTCGGKVFCMNVCDKVGENCGTVEMDGETVKREIFNIVVKAAETMTDNSFEAKPFTGAMDLAGNALDGAPLGRVDQATNDPVTFADNPDNYFWSFSLVDKKYDKQPYLQKIIPGLDAENIKFDQNWQMNFSAIMLIQPFYDIIIEEHPAQPVPLCKAPRVVFDFQTVSTIVEMRHCPFLDGRQIYYLPVLTSDLLDAHFMCFNPGKGPGGEAEIEKKAVESSVCDEEAHPENCCATVKGDQEKVFCCNGLVNAGQNEMEKCLQFIKNNSPLP